MIPAEWKRLSSFEEHLRMDRGLIVKYSWSKSMVVGHSAWSKSCFGVSAENKEIGGKTSHC